MQKTFPIFLTGLIIVIIVLFAYNQYNQQKIQNIGLSSVPPPLLLGNTDYGKVERMGPYGNKDSQVKIAYIVGVHPLESNSHKAIVESLLNHQNSLKYSYYIYNITVTKDRDDYDKGRINGQILANKYVVSDIKNQSFRLAVDVHSNRGYYAANRGYYAEIRFVFSPIEDRRSESIAFSMRDRISWLKYYVPPPENGTSSPPYVTIPLIKAGIPAIIYETYMNESYDITKQHADDFVLTVDTIKI